MESPVGYVGKHEQLSNVLYPECVPNGMDVNYVCPRCGKQFASFRKPWVSGLRKVRNDIFIHDTDGCNQLLRI